MKLMKKRAGLVANGRTWGMSAQLVSARAVLCRVFIHPASNIGKI